MLFIKHQQDSRIGRQSNLFKHTILEMKTRGMQTISARYLIGQRKATKQQRIKTEANGTTTTTTTMTAANLSLVPNNVHHMSAVSNGSGNSGGQLTRPSASMSSSSSNDCEMLNLNYQQRTMTTTTNVNNGSGAPAVSATGSGYHQAPQQIIAVNQFTTNQYIINTGGQAVMSGQMLPTALAAPDNLMKLNTTASVLGATGHYANNSSGYYTGPTSGVSTSGSWYNTNDFNLDLNNNQLGNHC